MPGRDTASATEVDKPGLLFFTMFLFGAAALHGLVGAGLTLLWLRDGDGVLWLERETIITQAGNAAVYFGLGLAWLGLMRLLPSRSARILIGAGLLVGLIAMNLTGWKARREAAEPRPMPSARWEDARLTGAD